MDARWFDRWTTTAAPRAGRRLAIGGLLGGAAGALFGQGIDAKAKQRGTKCDRCPARCACYCDDRSCVFGAFTADPNAIPAVCQKACGAVGWTRFQVSQCEAGKQFSTTAVCIWGQSGLEVARANCPV